MRSLGAIALLWLPASGCLVDNPWFQEPQGWTDSATSGGTDATVPGAEASGGGQTATSTGTGSGSESAGPSGGSATATSGTSTGAQAGGSSTGGDATMLVGDDALVVRYFLDEQADGMPGPTAFDAGPPPAMDLQVSYDASDAAPRYRSETGNRGLEWGQYGDAGLAFAGVAGSKLEGLHGSTAMTMEVVAEVTSVFPTDEPWARLVVWQPDVVPYQLDLGLLAARHNGEFALDLRGHWYPDNSPQLGRWRIGDPTGRVVVHVVIDTEQAYDDRVRLYTGGVRLAPDLYAAPNFEETIAADPDSYFVLGNRPANNASLGGTLFYVAVYDRPLSDAEIANNAARLQFDDDF